MAELLELVEEALDEIALFIKAFGVGDVLDAPGMGRDAGAAVLLFDDVPDPVIVVGPISKNDGSFWEVIQQQIRHRGVVGLAGGEFELYRQAIADDTGMELGGQSSATTTDTSISTLFFWAAA